MRLTYTLRIEVPDDLDPDVRAEIEDWAESHDRTLSQKIARYIGGEVDSAEDYLSAELPEGWYAAIDGGSAGDDDE